MTPVSFVKTTESSSRLRNHTKVCRLGHHVDSAFTGKDQNGPNDGIGPDCAGRAQQQ